MAKIKIKKDDTVIVLLERQKDQKVKSLRLSSENRAMVEGVNMVSKHTKPNAANPQGGIIKQESQFIFLI